uniref:Cathelicidin antimicrobial peptide n=1 Tax=Ateles fusciceps TaxID=9508 RepID=CAMP_ATEFU|nr:RecName: Full=Cathelicidin antimicrobial peptide; Contains: RecName: Full=Antibacterial peptide FALL-39; AltName: Full=FALL-39 peptide antibiotic; Contains: RecName: Full=Antibacterial peptide LL-37; Flags: Precursor [Ateles fusciceps]ABE96619.1 cathelicidin [Ateles fusciceps]
MNTQWDSPSLGRWSLVLLLLGLVMPLAIVAQVLSYQEAVLRAIDGINQRSSDANLYRLLDLDPRPTMDGDPDTPKPVSFTVKETVCPRTIQRSPEECDFREDGLVKWCVGTVTLNQAKDSFDISCDKDKRKVAQLGDVLQKAGEKIVRGLKNIGQRIKDFFGKLTPRTES